MVLPITTTRPHAVPCASDLPTDKIIPLAKSRACKRPRGDESVRSGPMSRVLSWTIIYLGPASPLASSAQPERGAGHTMALLFAFAPEGACQATLLPGCWWSLTPPFQLFSHPPRRAAGVFFSAALSVGSPRPAVSRLPALWSPDFPHDAKGTPRSSGPLRKKDCSTCTLEMRGDMQPSPAHRLPSKGTDTQKGVPPKHACSQAVLRGTP